MTNWLLRFLLSLSLAFFFVQGQSHPLAATHQNGISSAQPAQLSKPAATIKIETKKEQVLSGVVVSHHKKDKSIQKLLIADNDDDDDNDELISAKKHLTDNCFFSTYLLPATLSDLSKNRLVPCQYISALSPDKHLFLCTLRI